MKKAKRPPTFREWLFKQVRRDDPIGDLARDAYADRKRWGPGTGVQLAGRLRQVQKDVPWGRGGPEVFEAYREAYAEWKKKRKRYKNPAAPTERS